MAKSKNADLWDMSIDELEAHIQDLSAQRAGILHEQRKANLVRDTKVQAEEMRKMAERASLPPEMRQAVEETIIKPQTLRVQAELNKAGA